LGIDPDRVLRRGTRDGGAAKATILGGLSWKHAGTKECRNGASVDRKCGFRAVTTRPMRSGPHNTGVRLSVPPLRGEA